MKSLGHSWACINFHKKSKNFNFSSRRSLKRKRASSGATRRAEKPVLQPKFSKMKKFTPNSLKFELKDPHQVLWSAKDASAKIWNLTCLFRLLDAFLVHAVSVVQLLSCSYDESVSVMVPQGMYQVYVWIFWKWEIDSFVSMPNVYQKNLRNCEEYRTMGKVNCQVKLRCANSHLTVGNWGFRDFANDMGKGMRVKGLRNRDKWE